MVTCIGDLGTEEVRLLLHPYRIGLHLYLFVEDTRVGAIDVG